MKLRVIALGTAMGAYLYVLIRIILFKGHSAELAYLIQQLQVSYQEPAHVLMRINRGISFRFMKFRERCTPLPAIVW